LEQSERGLIFVWLLVDAEKSPSSIVFFEKIGILLGTFFPTSHFGLPMLSSDQFLSSIYSLLTESPGVSFGEFIESKLDALNISKNQFCKALGIETKTLRRILSGEQQKIDVITLLKISQFLGIDYRELSQLYVSDLEVEAIRGMEAARKAGYIIRTFDLDGLKKCGFLKDTQDFGYIEHRILSFYGLKSIFDYDSLLRIPLFSRTRRSASDKMLQFWCSTVLHELRLINNPNPFDPQLLRQIIPKVRIMSCDETMGLLNIARALYAAGVTVIVHSYVKNTQIRGATFVVDDKPCIVLQDYRQDYATLWFALAHELYHVWRDYDRMRHLKYHLTGEASTDPNLFDDQLTEDLANEFASELLLPTDKREFIASVIDVPGSVQSYAKKWGVHESIIYGQYSYHNKDYRFTHLIAKPDKAIRHLMVHPWDKESLDGVVAKLHLVYT
jgi:Zn-dependent peptidase ImmA (M78 family)/transcriptional regulator with XRE-family HTH domain